MRSTKLAILLIPATVALAGPLTAGEPKRCDWEVNACVKSMVDSFRNKGWIGIEIEFEESGEATVSHVLKASPAQAAGLQPGDRVIAFEGVAYAEASEEELREAKKALVPGRTIRLTVVREGETLEVPVVAAVIPEAVLAQWIGHHVLEQHRHQFEAVASD